MVKYYHDEKSSEDQFLGHKKDILVNYNYFTQVFKHRRIPQENLNSR